MHWTYKDQPSADLEQGDILQKTSYLVDEVLTRYHPYYATHPDNLFFIVLTQSCDLVRRKGACKSEYFAMAPVRPLRIILEREFAGALRNRKTDAQSFGSLSTRGQYEDFLTKLFNNNNSKYFFLEKQEDRGLPEDMCAVLPLSISIKAEHYDECLNARLLQLDDAFQAKLGYLIGQQYSKVGTRDWDDSAIERKVDDIVSKAAVWVRDTDMSALSRGVSEYEAANAGAVVDGNQLANLMKGIPTRKHQAMMAVLDFLAKQGLIPEGSSPERLKLRKALNSDQGFAQFFRDR